MTPERHQQIKRVFLAVLEQPRPKWGEVLDRLCAGEEELRSEVQLLLDCHVDVREMLPGGDVAGGEEGGRGGAQRGRRQDEKGTRPTLAELKGEAGGGGGGASGETIHTRPTEESKHAGPDAGAIPLRDRGGSRGGGEGRGARASGQGREGAEEGGKSWRPRSSVASEQGRFLPGALIADRYRIVALVGRGGMGEVYRADDLKIGETVALKFLPHDLAENAARMQALVDEVRVARAVSHPNVCRVYDIGEHHHELFISMEFVDGETLDSLISRIGRLPEKKAEQIAQQLCAGLAAIHDEGVLHRDLKPSNVMIDGRGHVRVNDFGLASVRDVYGLEAIAGTPGFVPPEALAGKSATLRSDIYALGLVLYELFTGVPAYRAKTREQLIREQEHVDPDPPSVHAPDLPRQVDEAIVRCLQRDAEARPRSAREVAGMLPGGDALAAALAIGETPSPALVAASGGRGILTIWQSIAAVVAFAGMLAIALMLGQYGSLLQRVPITKSPDVLAERARDVLRALGYGEAQQFEAFTLDLYDEWLAELVSKSEAQRRGERMTRTRPAPIDFWYRSSKSPLLPRNPSGEITFYDPTVIEQSMIAVRLSPSGQLREVAVNDKDLYWPKDGLVRAEAAPAGASGEPAPPKEPDFRAAFQLAGLDMSKFVSVQPKRVPPVYADSRYAWVGVYPESPDEPVQVEIASYEGRIVAFRTVELNWQKSQSAVTKRSLLTTASEAGLALLAAIQLASIVVAIVLARRNLREGRGDRLGAARLAIFVLGASLAYELLSADTLSNQNIMGGIVGWIVARSVTYGVAAWLLYIGFEPYVRRVWPSVLISWSRLVDGRWRDPLVGQSMLIGGTAGCVLVCLVYVNRVLPTWVGLPSAVPYFMPEFALDGLGNLTKSIGMYIHMMLKAVEVSIGCVAMLALARLVFKKPWLTLVVWCCVQTAIFTLGQYAYTGWWSVALIGAMVSIAACVMIKYGLLGLIAMTLTFLLVGVGPVTLDNRSWFHERSITTLVIVCVMMAYGAMIATIPPAQRRLASGSGTVR